MKYKKPVIIILIVLAGLIILPPFIYWSGVNILNKTNGTIVSGGEKRNYLIHIPKSYTGEKPVPLVLCFHGFADWPSHQMEMSGWTSLADREGFIAVFPEGKGFPRRWRSKGKYGSGLDDDPQKDVTFVSELIDNLSSKYRIDPKRIYANGLSNGGGMSHLLACKLSNRIAAIAGVAGAYSFDSGECKPLRPVPFMIFHGTADKIVPYNGGISGQFTLPDINGFASRWAEHNGCSEKISSSVSTNVSRMEYTSCRSNADVVVYTITGGGHTWPGGKPMPEFIAGKTTDEINATELIWKFFKSVSSHN